MKWQHAVLLIATSIAVVAVFVVQLWVSERQLDRQRVAAEQHFAAQQADMERWWAQQRAGKAVLPPPFRPAPPVMPLPIFPWLFVWPALMAPLWFVVVVETQRVQKQQCQEEEDLTPYTEEELMQDWEFKIVRCIGNQFEQPAFLERILAEEAPAGWRLVEKFDGARVRLKRPGNVRADTDNLPAGYDPYRTNVGPRAFITGRQRALIICWLLFILFAVLLPVGVVFQFVDPISPTAFTVYLSVVGGGAVLFGVTALGLTLRARRQARRRQAAG